MEIDIKVFDNKGQTIIIVLITLGKKFSWYTTL